VRIVDVRTNSERVAESANREQLNVAIAQIAPVWLDREATLAKVGTTIELAAQQGAQLIAFGEALVQGVVIERGDLSGIAAIARANHIAVYLGVMERAPDRGGHSLYCSLVFIDAHGEVRSTHRKLQPTYEERLVWAQGDGHGLVTHPMGSFTLGGLNCWENWMPLPRAALYAQGCDLHVSVWPGGMHNTPEITRFIARESRSYVIASCGVLRAEDIPADVPMRSDIIANGNTWLANGGSTLVGPNGNVLIEPLAEQEALLLARLDHQQVREERHNFDPAGHYSRPDVLQLTLDSRRQSTLRINAGNAIPD